MTDEYTSTTLDSDLSSNDDDTVMTLMGEDKWQPCPHVNVTRISRNDFMIVINQTTKQTNKGPDSEENFASWTYCSVCAEK